MEKEILQESYDKKKKKKKSRKKPLKDSSKKEIIKRVQGVLNEDWGDENVSPPVKIIGSY